LEAMRLSQSPNFLTSGGLKCLEKVILSWLSSGRS
jgi:hypothetical protein